MPFVWTTNPNLPPVTPAPVIGPTEVSTEVGLVANTVNVSPIFGQLSYNTNNIGYDVTYVLPTLNVKDLHVDHLESNNVHVNFNATINTANIGAASINTANILTATIANGRMGTNPTSNLQIATKEYVDLLAANSVPLGGNLQLLIQAAGDLLVGVSDNTAERLPIGTDSQVLATGGVGNTGVHWSGPFGSTTSHKGLSIGTNWSGAFKNTEVTLISVDEIVMDDGTRVPSGWSGLKANIRSNVETSGVGYLDTGVVQPNTCYEVYAIRSSSNGAQGLLLHRAKDYSVDVHYAPTASSPRSINFNNGLNQSVCLNVAQRFVAHQSGPFVGIDLVIGRQGFPRGNVWVTLEDNLANNNASGIILATSRKFPANIMGDLVSTPPRVRFPFDVSANVVQGNVYWAVIRTDYTQGNIQTNLHNLKVYGDSSTPTIPYADGPAKFFNANTNGWALCNSAASVDGQSGGLGPSNLYHRTFIEANSSAVTMPTGYDQKCLLSYCSTTKTSTLREYHQRGYRMSMSFHYTWNYINRGGLQASQGTDLSTANNTAAGIQASEAVNMGAFVPPVPCFVWIYHYSGLAGSAIVGGGGFNCLNLPVQLFRELDGGYTVLNNGGSMNVFGPFLCEFAATYTMSGGTFSNLYVAAIEF